MPETFENSRLEALLKAIVEEYIETAKPISSKQLAVEHDFGVSPATLRSDMATLEDLGYIEQPHTSAGRIPTESGYQYYISHFLHKQSLSSKQKRQLDTAAQSQADSALQSARQMAKTISNLTEEMVIMSVGGGEFFYTGVSNMLRKPEFLHERDMMLQVSDMFDEIEGVMQTARKEMHEKRRIEREDNNAPPQTSSGIQNIEVLIGDRNPVARHCAMIIAEYDQDGEQHVFGILGPMRMDYNTNISILQYLEQFIHKQKRIQPRNNTHL